MIPKLTLLLLLAGSVWFLLVPGDAGSFVLRKEGRTYIVDRTGDLWDISQAVSIGFKPEGFQYGIGKHAFTPLDDTDLTTDTGGISPDHRVLGVEEAGEAKAYSIPKLSGHEVANSEIGARPVAAAY